MSCMVFYSVFLTRPSICTYFIDDLVDALTNMKVIYLEKRSLFYHSGNY